MVEHSQSPPVSISLNVHHLLGSPYSSPSFKYIQPPPVLQPYLIMSDPRFGLQLYGNVPEQKSSQEVSHSSPEYPSSHTHLASRPCAMQYPLPLQVTFSQGLLSHKIPLKPFSQIQAFSLVMGNEPDVPGPRYFAAQTPFGLHLAAAHRSVEHASPANPIICRDAAMSIR